MFEDPELLDYFIARSSTHFKEPFVKRVRASLGVDRKVAEKLFTFQTYGCSAVAIRSIGISDEEWSKVKTELDGVLFRGLSPEIPTNRSEV